MALSRSHCRASPRTSRCNVGVHPDRDDDRRGGAANAEHPGHSSSSRVVNEHWVTAASRDWEVRLANFDGPARITPRSPIKVSRADGCVLAVSGELSPPSPGLLTRSLSKALSDAGRVLVDVAGLRLASPAGVQVFPSVLAGAGGWPRAEQPARPVRHPELLRRRLQRRRHDLAVINRARPACAGLIRQPADPAARIPGPPTRHGRPRHPDPGRDLHNGQPVRGQQHNPRTLRQPGLDRGRPQPAPESFTIAVPQGQRCCTRTTVSRTTPPSYLRRAAQGGLVLQPVRPVIRR
jgi:hypothetical protein